MNTASNDLSSSTRHWCQFLICLALVWTKHAIAEDNCLIPNVALFLRAHATMIGDPPFTEYEIGNPTATYLDASTKPGSLRWMGVRWAGPDGGALFLIDCQEAPIAAARIGAVLGLNAGPTTPSDEQTIEVRYVALSGTGLKRLATAVVSLRDRQLHTLWTHTTAESVDKSWGGTSRRRFFTWVYERQSVGILVRGSEFSGAGDVYEQPNVRPAKALSAEHYCWNLQRRRYLRCDLIAKPVRH